MSEKMEKFYGEVVRIFNQHCNQQNEFVNYHGPADHGGHGGHGMHTQLTFINRSLGVATPFRMDVPKDPMLG